MPFGQTPSPMREAIMLAIVHGMPVGVLVVDAQGKILQTNAELNKMFGYPDGELPGQSLEVLLPTDLRSLHRGLRDRYLADPAQRNMGEGRELFGQRRDGSRLAVEIGLNPVHTDAGACIVATVSDITPRKRLESTAQQLIAAAPCGMVMTATDGTIKLVNRQLCELFGYPAEALVGQPLELLVPERYREAHAAHLAAYAENPSNRAMGPGRDLTGLRRDGSEFPVEVGLNVLDDHDGKALLATVIDITERKRMELNLRQANESLDEFTYVASHDLRSPLRGIADLLEWIEEDLGGERPPEVDRNLERIKLRIARMEHLIDDLLAYARVGFRHTKPAHIQVPQLLDDVIAMQDPPPGIRVSHHCEVQEMVTARTPLETVLRNLVGNAIKHHDRSEGEVRITAQAHDAHVVFTVHDDGPGIPEDAKERIFKLFQPLSHGDRPSGVGLAISKRLVNAHSGELVVLPNTDGRGSSFRFTWPRFSRSDIDG